MINNINTNLTIQETLKNDVKEISKTIGNVINQIRMILSDKEKLILSGNSTTNDLKNIANCVTTSSNELNLVIAETLTSINDFEDIYNIFVLIGRHRNAFNVDEIIFSGKPLDTPLAKIMEYVSIESKKLMEFEKTQTQNAFSKKEYEEKMKKLYILFTSTLVFSGMTFNEEDEKIKEIKERVVLKGLDEISKTHFVDIKDFPPNSTSFSII